MKSLKIIGYIFLIWWIIGTIFWMARHPDANQFTTITNFTKVLTFKVNEDLKR